MNTSDFQTPSPHDDDGFDARARGAHAAAQGALSPRVRAQLQQRRRLALAGKRPMAGVPWVPTLAMAATLALAVGLGLRLWTPATVDGGTDTPTDAPVARAWASETQPGAAADNARGTTSGTTAGTTAGTAPRPGAQGGGMPTALAAAEDGAGRAPVSGGSAASDAGDPRATGTPGARLPAGSVEADVDTIAALLAAPAGDEAIAAGDAPAAGIAQDDALLAALEESPDFYLWLSADDGADVEAL